MTDGRVEDKVAFITGAARGQGRSHAVRLAQEGADIIAVDICHNIGGVPHTGATEDDLFQTVQAVEATGRRIVATRADVRDRAALQAAVDDGVREFGRLDIVSANAGILSTWAHCQNMTEESWSTMIDINLSGVWRTAAVCIPHLIAGGRGGSIVLTSSTAGFSAFPGFANYISAKHGVVGLMRTLALELAPHSIRVNSVHPTQVDTPMIMNKTIFSLFVPGVDSPGREDFAPVSQQMHALPVPWVEPIDVSNVVLFLASDEARYITGAALPVDAGSTIK